MPSHWGVRISTYELEGGHKRSVHSTVLPQRDWETMNSVKEQTVVVQPAPSTVPDTYGELKRLDWSSWTVENLHLRAACDSPRTFHGCLLTSHRALKEILALQGSCVEKVSRAFVSKLLYLERGFKKTEKLTSHKWPQTFKQCINLQ